jgi:hypothetical protein
MTFLRPFGTAAALCVAIACSSSPTSPTSDATGTTATTAVNAPGANGSTVKVVGVGDIGMCGSPGTSATARLVGTLEGQLLLAGDIAYYQGSALDFRNCFDPDWGRFRPRWHPVPGNHEYETPNASGDFGYFGAAADPDGLGGYYSFSAGEWLILMLNSSLRGADQASGSSSGGNSISSARLVRWLCGITRSTHQGRTAPTGSCKTCGPFWKPRRSKSC